MIAALSRLKTKAKIGDTVYVFYSGHGIRVGTKDYLLPYDFKGIDPESGVDTAYEEDKFYERLSQVAGRPMSWYGISAATIHSARPETALRSETILRIPKSKKAGKLRALPGEPPLPTLVKLFACSPGQSSYEWLDKGQGYFTYFLERGLRGAAADGKGQVTVKSLKDYLYTQVSSLVSQNENAKQTPNATMEGTNPEDLVLATGTSVATEAIKNITTRSTISFEGAPKDAEIKVGKNNVKGFTWETDLLEPEQEVTVTITSPGYRPKQFTVKIKQGMTLNVPITLEKDTTAEPGTAEPGNVTKVPPPQTMVPGALGAVMDKIRQAHNWSALSSMRAFKMDGSSVASVGQDKATQSGFNLIQHPDERFRLVYTDAKGIPINAGFNGSSYWHTTGNKRDTPKPIDRFGENPIAPLIHFLASPPNLSERFSKLNNNPPYLQGKDDLFGDIKLFYDPKTFLITKIDVKASGNVLTFIYSGYNSAIGAPIPSRVTVEAALGGLKIGEIVHNFTRIEANAALGTDYYLNGR
ncbi:MAG: caspase family protein [Armatimonas sp.]